MKDIMQVAQIIIETIENKYANDIAIFAYYGSQATGHSDAYSDLDFFFIPKTDKGKEANLQFIIDGIGFDLFAIPWDRIGRIAALEQPLTSVLVHSKVLYSASQEDLEKYEAILQSIGRVFEKENREMLLSKSKDCLDEAIISFNNMKDSANATSPLKIEGHKMLMSLLLSTAYANNTYMPRSPGKSIPDLLKLEHIPQNFEELINEIIRSTDQNIILESAQKLIRNTRTMIYSLTEKQADREPYETLFAGYYEELKSSINKTIRACNEGDIYTAYFKCCYMQDEIAQFLTKAELGLWFDKSDAYTSYKGAYDKCLGIDLTSDFTDLNRVKAKVKELDTAFRTLLVESGVDLVEFETVDQFKAYITGA